MNINLKCDQTLGRWMYVKINAGSNIEPEMKEVEIVV